MARSVGLSRKTSRSTFTRGAGYLAPLLCWSVIAGCSPEPTSQGPASPRAGVSSPSLEVAPGAREPIVHAARVYPEAVSLESTLRVDVQGEDPEGRSLAYKYQWVVNDLPDKGAKDPQFTIRQLKNGDRIHVEVTPSTGTTEGRTFKSSAVTVGNTAPEILEIFLEPMPIHRGDILKLRVVAQDPDGDQIVFTYKWLQNGKELPGETRDALDTKMFRKKDTLAVIVTASDGKASRDPKASVPVTIENVSPRITSTPPAVISDGQYAYQVTATDADEDKISYALKMAPPGMSIDTVTGKLLWKLTPESKGRHRVVIVAKDSDNALAEQDFELDAQTPAQPDGTPPTDGTPPVAAPAPQ
jgi:Putative Ig domain